MLDTETKRRIDTARDILVGKVPDPKSQVEQITIALIYKFMDDMDKEAISFGGKATFFTGEYEQYSWTNIFDTKVGGHEMLTLYGEAIVKLNLNPNIPQLFRDIFKNAYLPYRDPETLKLFLKTINEFSYDHSEKLGDAFEYLLSIMGSQGDAGQFRTPRHIIDFIVEIIQPKKSETICDPACGTAGFLISSYKHILQANSKKSKGDLLTPDDRNKMTKNFVGYDISPDMVRLSLVNMYLHGFTTPSIYEYDTLTSEDRWSEYFDVVIANPPFMTPKGGIKPHKRFTVQANRSEVLFVDYIAEHIHPSTGRAGIIVPEGIIFQSATAYKALRKMLVDKNYLYAVVSLPAGVFNPYSGVKTSILLMDKTLAKKTDKILFVKIENDGFDLGAQRREIDKNDLPFALSVLQEYNRLCHAERSEASITEQILRFAQNDKNVLLVDKKKIGEKEDYNLSVDRYRLNDGVKQSHFEMVRLGDVCEFQSGSRDKGGALSEGIPSIGGEQISEDGKIRFDKMKYISEGHFSSMKKGILQANDVLIVKDGATTGKTGFYFGDFKKAAVNEHVYIFRSNEKVLPYFLYHTVRANNFQFVLKKYIKGIIGGISSEVSDIEIPLPPIEIQQQIVSKIESYQAIINGAKQVVENYKPQIEIKDDWEMVELGSVCELNPKKSELKDLPDETLVSFVPMADMNENRIDFIPKETKKLSEVVGGYTYFRNKEVIVAKVTPCFENGKAGIASNLKNEIGFGSSEYYVLRCGEKVLPVWIYLQIISDKFRAEGKEQMTGTGGLQRVPKDFVNSFQIPLPTISEQQEIVKRIEQEQQLVNGSKQLIAIFEQKIKDEINKLWKQEPKEYATAEEKLSIAAEE